MPDEVKREHHYHAESTILTGALHHPLVQEIKPQSYVQLSGEGGYLSEHGESFRLEGLISFRDAYTQVAGNRDPKDGHGWSTLSTSVVEGLNVMEVVTADRVVGQIAADYPLVGYVPHITFLGTRFENLRIAGHPVNLDLHPDPRFFGDKPENDAPYTRHPGFVERVTRQFERIRAHDNLPPDILARYNQIPSSSDDTESIECSLVNQVSGQYPGRSFGHVIDIPNFGKIYLGVVRLTHSDFENGSWKKTLVNLTMIELEMGCIGGGKAGIVNPVINGSTQP